MELSRTGLPVFKVGGRYVHSPYDPVREAEQQFRSSGYAGQPVVVFFGIGAGYGLLPLLKEAGCRRLVLVEEKPEHLALSCDVVDYGLLAEKRSMTVCIGPGVPDFRDILSGCAPNDLFVIEQQVLVREDPAGFYREAQKAFRFFLKSLSAEVHTTGFFSWPWCRNTLLNLPRLGSATDLSAFQDAFRGYACAVVAAGPSLEGSLELLRSRSREGAVIITAASASRRLAAAGIAPHFIVSTDAGFYNSWNTRGGLADKRSILVTDLSTHHGVLPAGKGLRHAFVDFGLGFGRSLAAYDGLLPRFTMAGTVSSSCMELAAFLGCGPVTLFGQDFGFPGLLTHCRKTPHEAWGLRVQTRSRSMETLEAVALLSEDLSREADGNGNPVLTSVKHLLYRDWFAKTWKGVRTASSSSVRTEGIDWDEGRSVFSNGTSPARENPFFVLERLVRPLRAPGFASGISGRLEALRHACEGEDLASLWASSGEGLGGEIRVAFGFEIQRAEKSGRITPELRRALRRFLRVASAVLRRLAS